jgi:hypothetical protein
MHVLSRNMFTTTRNLQIRVPSRGHDRQSSDPNFSSRAHDRQSLEQNNQMLISLHNNGEDDKRAHGFADF